MAGFTTPSQAWAILSRHARDDIAPLRLKELCTDDDRVSSLVAVHNGSEAAAKRIQTSLGHSHNDASSSAKSKSKSNLNAEHMSASAQNCSRSRLLIADLSRQRMTLETLNHLLHLSTAVDVRGFIRTLAWGQNDRNNPITSVQDQPHNHYGGYLQPHNHYGDQNQGQGQFPSQAQNQNHNNNPARRSHFSFDQQDHDDADQHPHPIPPPPRYPAVSPSRSTTSTIKKTRFADHDRSGTATDDQTVLSTATNNNISPNNGNGSITSPTNANAAKLPLHTSPSMHMALRAPSKCNLQMYNSKSVNILDGIHNEWNRIQSISECIRKGQMRGASGHLLQNILVVGRGTACAASEFVYQALKFDRDGSEALRYGIAERKMTSRYGRSIRFLSRVDPVALHSALFDWNPEHTLVISIVMNGDESDIMHLTEVVKKWLYQNQGGGVGVGVGGSKKSQSTSHVEERMWGKHILFVTGSDILYRTQSVTKVECSFLIPPHARSEGFTSLTAAGILPLAIAFGWDIVQEMLHGAHDLDSHFVETNPRHNLPVLLALVDIWNDHFLPSVSKIKPCGGRIISPFVESFASYPAFVAAIEAQVCSRVPMARTRNPHHRVAPSGIVIDGGLCGNFDRVSFQGGRSPPSELIISMDSQVPHTKQGLNDYSRLLFGSGIAGDEGLSNQDHLICSFFAHADVMAVGSANDSRSRDGRSVASGYTFGGLGGAGSASFDTASNFANAPHTPDTDTTDGNHPSTLLLCSQSDAFGCGQLIALAEHRAMIMARLWDIENPFAFAESHGSILRSRQEDFMREKLESTYQRLDLVGDLHEDDDDDEQGGAKVSIAVKTLLGHYATNLYDKKRQFR